MNLLTQYNNLSMELRDKKGIQIQLLEAIDREELPNREAARMLNIHPCYISMLKNEKLWDSITQKVWSRFEEWAQTREPLKSFKIPQGEEIYTVAVPRKAQVRTVKKTPRPPKHILESSPENPIQAINTGVWDVLQDSEEIAALHKKFEEFYRFMGIAQKRLEETEQALVSIKKSLDLNNEALLRLAATGRPSTIIFQRNIYKGVK